MHRPRDRYKASIDEILSEPYDFKLVKPCIESKVFGIGVEAYTVGSAEFALSYAAFNQEKCIPLMDNGHYHPTEVVSGSHLGWEKKVGLKSAPSPLALQKSTHFLKCFGSSLSRSTQRGDPEILGGTRQGLHPHQSVSGRGAGATLHHEHLDGRRL